MSVATASINISALTPSPKPINENVVVGKDILDLLAGSMYVDPLNVYREYLQNAADAIDQARDAGLAFEEEAGVQIFFDHAERSIRIRDNGISIPFSEFVQRIVTVGASQKRGKKLRGFRGVGRLSGLGYCQELIFRGRAEGNPKVTEIRWDGRALKARYRDHQYNGSLADLVKEVTTVTLHSPMGFPSRFFEVELRKVARLKNDILLNEEVVRNYISQVAPVPFKENFEFKDQINTWVESFGIKPTIKIELMDGKGPIFHRVENSIEISPQQSDKIRGVDLFKLIDSDGEVCACGWLADHSYSGSIPKRLGLGGVRLRSGNIQVGDETILSPLFPESRFSGWAIGDIHVVSPKILPNGRRDEFEPSPAYSHLQSELVIKTREISQRIRDRSASRNKLRAVDQKMEVVSSWIGLDSDNELPSLIREILVELSTEKIGLAKKELLKLDPEGMEFQLAETRLNKVEASANSVLLRQSKNMPAKPLSPAFKKPIVAALKTIISAAKTPDAGIQLSLDVLEVIEKEI